MKCNEVKYYHIPSITYKIALNVNEKKFEKIEEIYPSWFILPESFKISRFNQISRHVVPQRVTLIAAQLATISGPVNKIQRNCLTIQCHVSRWRKLISGSRRRFNQSISMKLFQSFRNDGSLESGSGHVSTGMLYE